MSAFRERRRPNMSKTDGSKSGHSDPMETNSVNLRRTMRSIIMSSEDFDEAGDKMLHIIKRKPGEEMTLCIMLLMCCSEDRTYFQYYGLLGQRICMNNDVIQRNFETCFVQHFSRIHQLEENKLLNAAKFFAHLLATDAISWHVLSHVRLAEVDTSESCRVFITVLFQELFEQLGIRRLNQRLMQMQDRAGRSILPRDDPENAWFAINFFVSIGLGGITENLMEYLNIKPKQEVSLFDYSESDKEEEEKRKKRRRTGKSIMDCFSSLAEDCILGFN